MATYVEEKKPNECGKKSLHDVLEEIDNQVLTGERRNTGQHAGTLEQYMEDHRYSKKVFIPVRKMKKDLRQSKKI